jgi:hypothetical protein
VTRLDWSGVGPGARWARDADPRRLHPLVDDPRWRARGAVGIGQLAYGVRQLRRRGRGWYHIVLGARQVLQAGADRRGLMPPASDAAVDGLHVATMLAVALVRRGHRRSALEGVLHALAWTALDTVLARRGTGSQAPPTPRVPAPDRPAPRQGA